MQTLAHIYLIIIDWISKNKTDDFDVDAGYGAASMMMMLLIILGI